MNKSRRQELKSIIQELQIIQDQDGLYACIISLESVKDEEEDYYDNIPENLQYSQRAEASEEAIGLLEEALDILNEIYDSDKLQLENIDEAIGFIKEVV